MSKSRVFLTLTGYQLTWLACIYGDNNLNNPFLGVYVGTTFLIFYLYFNKNILNFLKISILISVPGYLFDTLMVSLSIYKFNSSLILGAIPPWMIVLWISFSTLFDEILVFFKKYKFFGIALSAILGPSTYFLGQPIGLISIKNIYLFFTIHILFWALLMIYYLEIILKKKSNSQ